MDEARLLDVKQLSIYLSTPVSTLYTMVNKNRIPGVVRLGRALRFDRGEIDLWIESRKTTAQTRTGE